MRSIKDECLNHLIPVSEWHLRRGLAEFLVHYRERNHQGLANEKNTVNMMWNRDQPGGLEKVQHGISADAREAIFSQSLTPLPPVYRWESVAAPVGAVHVLHGMSDHAGRYSAFANALNRAGFLVWAHDHRGHGRNPTPPLGLGHFADENGWRLLVEDAWRVSDELRTIHHSLPLVLVGHSLGSFVAQALMAERGAAYRAVVLSGTNGPSGILEHAAHRLAQVQRLALGGRAPGRWLTRLVFGHYNRQFAPNRTRFDWLSRDEREVDGYVHDEWCGVPLSVQSWVDFLEGRTVLGTAEHLRHIPKDLPIHILAGSRDPVGDNLRGVQRMIDACRQAGIQNVSCVVYNGARHEVFHESNREDVFRDLATWLTTL